MTILLLCCYLYCLFLCTVLYSIQFCVAATADQGLEAECHFSVAGGVKGNRIWGVGMPGCAENTE